MIRRLFTLLSALSLLLCVGTCVMWVRSRKNTNNLSYGWVDGRGEYRWVGIESIEGRVAIEREGEDAQLAAGWPWDRVRRKLMGWEYFHGESDMSSEGFDDLPQKLGVRYGTRAQFTFNPPQTMMIRTMLFPWVYVTAMATVCPALLCLRNLTSSRRGKRGLCPVCGYDLRATPDRCPECGMLPTSRS
jgi:hypothetical protein